MKEKEVWSVATGRVNPFKRRSRQAVDFITTLDGFVGVKCEPPFGNLWFFDSENAAKTARNKMEDKGIICGKNICKAFIPDKQALKEHEKE